MSMILQPQPCLRTVATFLEASNQHEFSMRWNNRVSATVRDARRRVMKAAKAFRRSLAPHHHARTVAASRGLRVDIFPPHPLECLPTEIIEGESPTGGPDEVETPTISPGIVAPARPACLPRRRQAQSCSDAAAFGLPPQISLQVSHRGRGAHRHTQSMPLQMMDLDPATFMNPRPAPAPPAPVLPIYAEIPTPSLAFGHLFRGMAPAPSPRTPHIAPINVFVTSPSPLYHIFRPDIAGTTDDVQSSPDRCNELAEPSSGSSTESMELSTPLFSPMLAKRMSSLATTTPPKRKLSMTSDQCEEYCPTKKHCARTSERTSLPSHSKRVRQLREWSRDENVGVHGISQVLDGCLVTHF